MPDPPEVETHFEDDTTRKPSGVQAARLQDGGGGMSSHADKVPEFVYASSMEEAQRLLDESYLKKYRAVAVEDDPLLAENQRLHAKFDEIKRQLSLYDISYNDEDGPSAESFIAAIVAVVEK